MEKQELLKVLNEYRELIKNNNFEELFEEVAASFHYSVTETDLAEFLLLDVGIPIFNYMERVPESLFFESKRIEHLVLPENIKEIGPAAFAYSSLESIALPKSLNSIKNSAFGKTPLQAIDMSDTSIKELREVFLGCTNLSSVILPKNLEILGKQTITSCRNLKEIVIPSSVKKIEFAAFWHCTSLEKIVFEDPSQLQVIEVGAFYGCDKLTEIEGITKADIINDEGVGRIVAGKDFSDKLS